MEIVYRSADVSDAENLLLYLKKVGSETDNLSYGSAGFRISKESEERFIRRFQNDQNSLMLVAVCDGEIVANSSIESNRILRYSHRAELSITVLRDFWGRGIGTRLMKEMIDFSRGVGIEVLHLEVRSDNLRAKYLYEKFGFKKYATFHKFFKIDDEYYDADFMNLYIQS